VPKDTHQWIVARANELGYFPSTTQAKQISTLSATRGYRGIPPEEVSKLVDWAVAEVMEGRATPEVCQDLQRVIAAWPALPEDTRKAILSLIGVESQKTG
jgi:hypothetical protein